MLYSLLNAVFTSVLIVLIFAGTLWAAETVAARGKVPDTSRRLTLISFLACYAAMGVVFSGAVTLLVGWPKQLLPITGLPSVIAGVLLADFFYYWMHRLQHSVPLLWRYHKVHHSVENLAGGYAVHHPSDLLLEWLCIFLPMSFLIAPGSSAIVAAIVTMQGHYLHSALKVHLGPVGGWIADNRHHRIHHSTEAHHFDQNFGAPTLIWDRLFGTYYRPAPDEWPDTGLNDHREPHSVMKWVFPYRSHAPVEADQSAGRVVSGAQRAGQ